MLNQSITRRLRLYPDGVRSLTVLSFLSHFICVSCVVVFVFCFLWDVFPFCVLVLLCSSLLDFPPHLSCIRFVSPALFPAFFPTNQLHSCSSVSSQHSPHPWLLRLSPPSTLPVVQFSTYLSPFVTYIRVFCCVKPFPLSSVNCS